MKTIFGPAGIPIECNGNNIDGLKHSIGLGLKAYEVEFVRGVRMNPKMAYELQTISAKHDVRVSCHAPFYLNCNNPEKYKLTRHHLHDCIRVSQSLKLSRIVFHVGYLMKMERETALKNSIEMIRKIINEAYELGYKDFTLGPEVAGKHTQIGSLVEVIAICKEFKECKPVIDWAHLHALTNGGLRTRRDFEKVINQIETELGKRYLKGLHCHYSNIEYTDKGERRHQPLGSKWGPRFKLLAEVIKDNDYEFTIICETPLIEQDALKMKSILNNKSL